MTEAALLLARHAGRVASFSWSTTGAASFSPAWWAQLGASVPEGPASLDAFTSRLHEDDSGHLLARLAALAASTHAEPFECEYRLRTARAEFRWFRASMLASRDEEGHVTGFEAAQVDIHALRSAESRLLTLNVELARVASAREDFLSSMSHELRTPLNAVLGQAQALTEGTFGVVTPQMREALEVITASGAHLLSLLNTVLDLARLEAGAMPLHREEVGLAAIAHESHHVIKPLAAKKRVTVRVSLVRCTADDVALLDRLRVRQVLVNLLSNAIKFSREDTTVWLTVQRDDEAWAFSVRDEGPGIDQADQLRLFHPFVQAEGGRARRHEGAGLGLALVKRLVDLHGGSVELESEPGKGSCFTIRLPIPPDTPPLAATPAPTIRRLKSAMIVDDNIINVEPLRRYLVRLGIEVRTAESGPEALELIARSAPQVLFLDWHMPGMDGLEVIRRLRDEPWSRTIKIIMLTALVGDHVRAEALAAGADAFLAKPARLAEAAALADSLLA